MNVGFKTSSKEQKSELSPSRSELDFLSDLSEEALITELRRVSALLKPGEFLTRVTCKKHQPKVSFTTLRRLFGGWKEALERADLQHLYGGGAISAKMRSQAAKTFSNEDLTAELQRVHLLVGKEWLTTNDFNAYSVTSAAAIRSRFGTWAKGLEVAGVPSTPPDGRRFTDAECFENIAKVWTHHARTPQYLEMLLPPSTVKAKTYITRWGTWRKALQAFVQWTNSEESSQVENTVLPMSLSPDLRNIRRRAEADRREIRPGLRFKVFKNDSFRCVACGRSPAIDSGVELHADHIVAVANGGKTIIENLQTLCRGCNLGKGKS